MTKKISYDTWEYLTGDCNWEEYGGMWAKRATDGRWWVVRFENKADWGDGALGFYCSLLLVDLKKAGVSGALESALASCGWEMDKDTADIIASYDGATVALFDRTTETWERALVDALVGYGAYAEMATEETHFTSDFQAERLRRKVIRLGEAMMKDELATRRKLAAPFNALGSTRSDMLGGNALAGARRVAGEILRGDMDGQTVAPHTAIVLKMYAATDGHTLGGACEAELAAAGRCLSKKEKE